MPFKKEEETEKRSCEGWKLIAQNQDNAYTLSLGGVKILE